MNHRPARMVAHLVSLSGLMLIFLTQTAQANATGLEKAQSTDGSRRQTETHKQTGNDKYVQDPNRRDWDNGYYKDVYGKYHPLNGADPNQLGNGGATPKIYYKVEQINDNEAKQSQ